MIPLDCPVCHAPFKEVVKEGVLIDVCTRCYGVWLDRGELETLLHGPQGVEWRGAGFPPATRRQATLSE